MPKIHVHHLRQSLKFVFVLGAATYISLLVYILSQSHLRHNPSPLKPAQAVMVLGSKVFINQHYNSCLMARVKTGVIIAQNHHIPWLIVTGGNDKEDNANEAEYMAKFATQDGFNPTQILQEKQSTSTYENMRLSQPILEQQHINSLIIVSDGQHLARAKILAKQLLKVKEIQTYRAENTVCWAYRIPTLLGTAREPLAWVQNILMGKIAL